MLIIGCDYHPSFQQIVWLCDLNVQTVSDLSVSNAQKLRSQSIPVSSPSKPYAKAAPFPLPHLDA